MLIYFGLQAVLYHGFYDPKDGPFYAARVYGTNDRNRPREQKPKQPELNMEDALAALRAKFKGN